MRWGRGWFGVAINWCGVGLSYGTVLVWLCVIVVVGGRE